MFDFEKLLKYAAAGNTKDLEMELRKENLVQSKEELHNTNLLEAKDDGNGDKLVRLLINAATHGHLETVKWLKENVVIKSSHFYQITPLSAAAANGHLDLVQWFLEREAMPEDNLLLIRAAEGGHLDVVKWLVNKFPKELRSINSRGQTALIQAAQNGHRDTVQWFLDRDETSKEELNRAIDEALKNLVSTSNSIAYVQGNKVLQRQEKMTQIREVALYLYHYFKIKYNEIPTNLSSREDLRYDDLEKREKEEIVLMRLTYAGVHGSSALSWPLIELVDELHHESVCLSKSEKKQMQAYVAKICQWNTLLNKIKKETPWLAKTSLAQNTELPQDQLTTQKDLECIEEKYHILEVAFQLVKKLNPLPEEIEKLNSFISKEIKALQNNEATLRQQYFYILKALSAVSLIEKELLTPKNAFSKKFLEEKDSSTATKLHDLKELQRRNEAFHSALTGYVATGMLSTFCFFSRCNKKSAQQQPHAEVMKILYGPNKS